MPYICQACGHKCKRASAQGTCPACQSIQLKVIKTQEQTHPKKTPKTKIEICVMIVLWALLIYGVYDKYLKTAL